jgi:hypothetical protein
MIVNILKAVLIILFFLCLFNMPYSFYQFVRFVALIGFVILAYQANQHGMQTRMYVYACLALLFQPFFKIALGREIWNIVALIVGAGLLISIFIKPKENPSLGKHICNVVIRIDTERIIGI